MEIIEELSKIGIVPVVALENVEDAEPLAKALCEGGIECAEITFRTNAASECILIMAKHYPKMLIGAGTILNIEQVECAINAGAKFIVSPGCNSEVVTYCIKHQIPILPGCVTPTEIEKVIQLGIHVVKFFPAEAAGGINMIKAIAAPYGNVKFMPTGGIDEHNLVSYLNFSKVIACGGSWMIKKELLQAKKFNEITSLTKQAVKQMLGFQVDFMELLDKMDTSEHIELKTNYLDRAIYYLERRGIRFDYETVIYDAKKKMQSICMLETIRDFNIMLVEK